MSLDGVLNANALTHGLGGIAVNIGYGCERIAESNEEIANANKKIAKSIEGQAESNKKIAKAIIESSTIITEGLTTIADEMERKRKTEEYYRLLDLIDATENKIIALGGNIKAIYENIKFSYVEPVQLSIPDIRVITQVFGEEDMEWLQKTCVLNLLNPLHFLFEVISKSRFEFKVENQNGNKLIYLIASSIDWNMEWKLIVDESSYSNQTVVDFDLGGAFKINENGDCTFEWKEDSFKVIGDSTRKSYKAPMDKKAKEVINSNLWIDCTNEDKGRLLGYIREEFEKEGFLTVEEMEEIMAFQTFVSQLNCDIILGNLRKLHTELLKAYKDLKLT